MSEPQAPPSGLGRWALSIVWPSFLMAGVLEMLVFACIDPADLHWFGGASMALSHQTIYSLAFFVFWGVISLAGALTALLMTTPAGESPNAAVRKWPY